MLIHVKSEIALSFQQPAAVVLQLSLHPTVLPLLRGEEVLTAEPPMPFTGFMDVYGNRSSIAHAPAGRVVFRHSAVVEDGGLPDPQAWMSKQHSIQELPTDVLIYLLPSRYCEVDSELRSIAWSMFGQQPAGWPLVLAICNFVHNHLRFDYQQARATRTALDAYRERVGVCRDFAHLAVTLCRCLNVPARYCTGYLGDFGIPPNPAPMDFSAWFEVYLGHQWYAFDARHNVPRIGRIPLARGRDATDVALTTSYGVNILESFLVWTTDVTAGG